MILAEEAGKWWGCTRVSDPAGRPRSTTGPWPSNWRAADRDPATVPEKAGAIFNEDPVVPEIFRLLKSVSFVRDDERLPPSHNDDPRSRHTISLNSIVQEVIRDQAEGSSPRSGIERPCMPAAPCGADDARISRRTLAGLVSAISWATKLPSEKPRMSTRARLRASRNVTASRAI